MAVQAVIKRNGINVSFDRQRIFRAIEKAFLSENITDTETVGFLTEDVIALLYEKVGENTITSVENIQDIVESVLMKHGHHQIAKKYILYRASHTLARQEKVLTQIREKRLRVRVSETETIIFDSASIEEKLRQLASDLMRVSITEMVSAILRQIYNNITQDEIDRLVLSAARERIETHYEYAYLAARIALMELYRNSLGETFHSQTLTEAYKKQFVRYIQKGIQEEMLNPQCAEFDCEKLAAALRPERDKLFRFLGIQILIDRYFLRDRTEKKAIFELPQWFWMRVAMGLALKEKQKEESAIAFYDVLSQMDVVSSTPTLFNSGTLHSQMSSCYLNTTRDSLESIFKLYSDNAKLSKWAGGIGSDWTRVRATGSKIKGTNGESQGVIPFIKIFNDVALAVNQGGKRKGAMCAYMEIWHLDIEQFLELRKNTGDERRRSHDINTACWIPDLFMKRVVEDKPWTLFCPSQVPDLHDLYGKAFENRYMEYEKRSDIRKRVMKAKDLWRKILTMLYETGHPWITFKDAANVRNPQDHAGVIHSSNLCTEITLNTSDEETAVCNLASLNLANMITNGELDETKVAASVETAIRMLDSVIDNNYYPIPEAERANFRHRAVGLGLMGYQDALYKLGIPFESEENLEFADRSMEMISYYAILASSKLAKEKGVYPSYKGSKWERGLFPLDTVTLLEQERGRRILADKKQRMKWETLKAHVRQYGMRNSNTMAIAPTATIANISGVYPCTEPAYKNIYMKENLSGNFIVVNTFLVDELEKLGLWNGDMLTKIKLRNGSVQGIEEIPEWIRKKYKETFEISMIWLMKSAALRAKWIDQSASTNVFISTKSGQEISDIYLAAWEYGLKTTYYLRSLGASQIHKVSVKVEKETQSPQLPSSIREEVIEGNPVVCTITDGSCEVCQ